MAGKDLLSRLADAGEEAIQRLGKMPGGEQVTGAMHAMRDRMDELQKRVRGLEELEKRIEVLETQVAALQGPKRTPARRSAASSARKPTSPRSRTTASQPPRGPSAPTGDDSPG